jgi:hypothetical protein
VYHRPILATAARLHLEPPQLSDNLVHAHALRRTAPLATAPLARLALVRLTPPLRLDVAFERRRRSSWRASRRTRMCRRGAASGARGRAIPRAEKWETAHVSLLLRALRCPRMRWRSRRRARRCYRFWRGTAWVGRRRRVKKAGERGGRAMRSPTRGVARREGCSAGRGQRGGRARRLRGAGGCGRVR